jgi:hypothetical protein
MIVFVVIVLLTRSRLLAWSARSIGLQHEAVSYEIGVYKISRDGALRVDAEGKGALIRFHPSVRSIERCD